MKLLAELISKVPLRPLTLGFGVLLLILAEYTPSGKLTSLEVHQRPSPSIFFLIAGTAFVLCAVLPFLWDEAALSPRAGCRLLRTSLGFKVSFKGSDLCVDFGRLEQIYQTSGSSAVVLPSNEFFDERCLNDVKTAAGAFLRHNFDAQQTRDVDALLQAQLKTRASQIVNRSDGRRLPSYGAGASAYIRKPLATPHRIIFSAVTTDRDGVGLHTEMVYIFQAMAAVRAIVLEDREVSELYIPLLGAGKGGVPPQLAFRALVIAALEARCAAGGHAIKQVHIVVYQPEGKNPEITIRQAKRAVRELVGLYKEISR